MDGKERKEHRAGASWAFQNRSCGTKCLDQTMMRNGLAGGRASGAWRRNALWQTASIFAGANGKRSSGAVPMRAGWAFSNCGCPRPRGVMLCVGGRVCGGVKRAHSWRRDWLAAPGLASLALAAAAARRSVAASLGSQALALSETDSPG